MAISVAKLRQSAMEFIDLGRRFSALDADKPFAAYEWADYGFGEHRGLGWDALLERPRVVVLAEASAGKTAEFRAAHARLQDADCFSFYVSVEALAANGLEGSLGREDAARLMAWRGAAAAPGWFFLDSVDEARINNKDVETALNRLARELDLAYDRARILLSCRGSVWTGSDDLLLLRRTLPVVVTAATDAPIDPDQALFAPLDSAKATAPKEKDTISDVTVVTLTALTVTQRATFLAARGVADPAAFEEALYAHDLQRFAGRPGDLGTLVGYWLKTDRFDGLSEMTELGIAERLAELNWTRKTLSGLTEDEVRAGAERLAAAMTLGRVMDLILPDQRPDEVEGLNPYDVLSDWRTVEVDALLQRGLFVPSTFGQVRFFHRSAQEYLTARWFARIGAKLTDRELLRVFVADSFGIRTVPPSLRAAAGWLATRHRALREELLTREPLVLILHGDPAKLALAEKERLLRTYAARHAVGDLAYARIDHQTLWMFAEPSLAPAIRAALAANARHDFRYEMLRLIEQGKIRDCLDIVREAALDCVTRPYHRIVATRTLRAMGDEAGLRRVAADMLAAPAAFGPELAPYLAVELFPVALSMPDLLAIIAGSGPGSDFGSDGFSDELVDLFHACDDPGDRRALVAGIAALAFEPPLNDWPGVSERHQRLVAHVADLARAAILDADVHVYGAELVTLLMAVERGGREDRTGNAAPLTALIEARPELKQALFWADVRRAIENGEPERPIVSVRQIWVGDRRLWTITEADHRWLDATLDRSDLGERRIALSALILLGRSGADAEALLDRLGERVATCPDLSAALAQEREPRVESVDERRWRERYELSTAREAERRRSSQQRLIELRSRLAADPTTLCDSVHLRTEFGFRDLWELTEWIGKAVESSRAERGRHWRRLAEAFGDEVAEAYRKGMKTMWRVTPPEAPVEQEDGRRTVKFAIILSAGGLVLEANEPGWAQALSRAETEIAIRHACIDDQGVPDWIGALLTHHEAVAAPHVASAMADEWASRSNHHPFLEKAAHGLPLPPALCEALLAHIVGPDGARPAVVDVSRRILARLELSSAQRAVLFDVAARRLSAQRLADEWPSMLGTSATLFLLDAERAASALFELLTAERRRRSKSRALGLLAGLFGRHGGLVPSLDGLRPATLARIVASAYRESDKAKVVLDDDDERPTRGRFDDAGGMALTALLETDGAQAHGEMLRLARDPAVGDSAHRLSELAYEMAERQSERPVWTPAAVRAFETAALAPIATGDDLLDLVAALIDDIAASFAREDMTSKRVVRTAEDERAVQDWLGEALEQRGRGRFHAFKESQVVEDDRPDIILSSASSDNQVAIEVKHGGKGWSFPDLETALTDQLSTRYLRPANRRHGILVISNHRESRFWRDPAGRTRMTFADVITRLQERAVELTINATGRIVVRVQGIDADQTMARSDA